MSNFRVIQCPNCGSIQSSASTTVFKCFGCQKSKTINPKSKFGLGVKVLQTFDNGKSAALFIQEYKRLKFEEREANR